MTYTKALRLLALPDAEEREKFLAEHDVSAMSTRELEQALKDREAALAEALGACGLVCAGTPVPGTGKFAAPGIPMTRLAELADYVLAEADGSAGRPMKAHASHEPVIPPEANQTICVVGASGFGRPIAEAVHRPALYARLAELPETAPVTPSAEAAVLRAEALHDRVYVNQAETAEAMASAAALAEFMDCPVLAGSLRNGEYRQCSR